MRTLAGKEMQAYVRLGFSSLSSATFLNRRKKADTEGCVSGQAQHLRKPVDVDIERVECSEALRARPADQPGDTIRETPDERSAGPCSDVRSPLQSSSDFAIVRRCHTNLGIVFDSAHPLDPRRRTLRFRQAC
jgi:hypothetical protein